MPLSYETFPPYSLMKQVRTALEGIDPANGYQTRPQVGATFVPMDAVQTLPFICLDPAVLQGDEQLFGGGGESFTEDADFGFVIWGYFEDEVDKEAAMWALLTDILSALWEEETFSDTVAGVDLVRARWDLAHMKDQSRGVLALEMKARLLFSRGGW